MNTQNLFFLLISFTVFLFYVGLIALKYGVRKSISDSYYYINHKPLFTLAMWGTSIPLMIVGSTGLMFFAGTLICFVGAAPNFKEGGMEEKVHVAGAEGGIAVACAAIWFDLHMWYLPVSLFILTIYGHYVTHFQDYIGKNKIKSFLAKLPVLPNHTWWVEVYAFVIIFIALFVKRVL